MKEVCICANDRLIRVILGFAPRVTIIVDDTLKMILEREEKGWRLYDEEGVAAALLQGEAISARNAAHRPQRTLRPGAEGIIHLADPCGTA